MKYGTIVICGGGCYGGYYVRQLARARAAGALTVDRILVVDRDPDCRVARLVSALRTADADGIAAHGWRLARSGDQPEPPRADPAYQALPIDFACVAWEPFFDSWFAAALADPSMASANAVVPSPLMPHLLADWVASQLRLRSATGVVCRVPLSATPETPWARTAPDLAHYASFATWMCPINCIEPPRCPETRSGRDWTMPSAVRAAVERAAAAGSPYDVVSLFHTTHRAYGVGMFDVQAAIGTAREIAAAPFGPLRVLVASVSHCHGALAELVADAAV